MIEFFAVFHLSLHCQMTQAANLMVNSFLASKDFCRLLITFANSLYPDQAQQNVGPRVKVYV